MRIAQIATLSTPVSGVGADSVETLVWLLARELTELGHEVTVFGAAGSQVSGEFVPTLPGAYGKNGSPDDWQLCEWINLCGAAAEAGRFDILHSHAYLWGMPLAQLVRAPMVHTLHVWPYIDQARLWELNPGAHVAAISRCQWSEHQHLKPAAVIPHGVDVAQFTFRAEPEDYVCYLGRFTDGKGVPEAILAARDAGLTIRLAGPRDEYFDAHIQPLVDDDRVRYVGFVSGAERDRFLGGARALLYPVTDPEPFGLVQVEAMLCGTPVAAIRIGAVGEIVDEGVTGCTASSQAELTGALRSALLLDRKAVRERAESRFSARTMALAHAAFYETILAGAGNGSLADASGAGKR